MNEAFNSSHHIDLLVKSALNEHNCCIFVCDQPPKMKRDESTLDNMVTNAIGSLRASKNKTIRISCTMLQVHESKLTDLLAKDAGSIQLIVNSVTGTASVSGATEVVDSI